MLWTFPHLRQKSPVPMLWAALIILVSVGGGTALAFLPRGRDTWMGPVRTFALTAALSVVLLHLLPEALEVAGGWALLVLAAGLLAPEALGKLGASLWRVRRGGDLSREHERHLALEASYFGLLLHRVGDGVGLGAFTGEMQAWSGSGGVVAALAAHAVPVVAIVVLTFDSVRGRDAALKRAVGLGVASMVGVFLARGLPGQVFAMIGPWVSAFVGGMLLHVVTHDLKEQPPRGVTSRLLDLGLGALGAYISFLGRDAHVHDEELFGPEELVGTLGAVAISAAPWVLLGVASTVLLARWIEEKGSRAPRPHGASSRAFFEMCRALSHPFALVPSTGHVPTAPVAGLFQLLAVPHLALVTLLLSVGLLGWKWTALRLLAVAFLLLGMFFLLRFPDKPSPSLGEVAFESLSHPEKSLRVLFDRLVQRTGPWLLVAMMIATLLDAALLPDSSLGRQLLRGAAVVGVFLLARVHLPASIVVVWALAEKGMAPGPWTAALLLGPTTRRDTWRILTEHLGKKGAFVALSFAFLSAAFSGWVASAYAAGWWREGVHPLHSPPEAWQLTLALLSGIIVVRAVYVEGLRGFLGHLQGLHGHSHAPRPRAPWGDPSGRDVASPTACLQDSPDSKDEPDSGGEPAHGHGHSSR